MPSDPRLRLRKETAALLVVDVQERLLPAMPQAAGERLVRRVRGAIQGARALGLPVVHTEQYPKGLGRTVAQVAELLTDPPIEKLDFSCAVPEVLSRLEGRSQVLVVGMETHVCVFQTVRDLSERGHTPYVLVDGVLSRTELDFDTGLALCRQAGAVVTTVEAALFDLLGRAGGPEFKLVSAAIR